MTIILDASAAVEIVFQREPGRKLFKYIEDNKIELYFYTKVLEV